MTGLGLDIRNGSTPGDERGECTFHGKKGQSVIDYIVTNERVLGYLEKMEVKNRIESDHLTIEVQTSIDNEETKEEKIIEYQDWTEKGIEDYRERINQKETCKDWRSLKLELQAAKVSKTKTIEINDNLENWWDEECFNVKKKVLEKFAEAKIDHSKYDEYLDERRKYRALLASKKKLKGLNIIEEIKNDKSKKTMWQLVGQQRKKRTEVDDEIKKEAWIKHFRKQLRGVNISQVNTEADKEYSFTVGFTVEQVNKIIKK